MKPHLRFVDGLRGIAALYVLLHHAYLEIPSAQAMRLGTSPAWRVFEWLLYGHFAVDFFIVLSGFCLMLPLETGGSHAALRALPFYKKRARRILPPYYCAMALSFVLIALYIGDPTGNHWDLCLNPTGPGVLCYALLLQDFAFSVTRLQLNHAFWSIAVEWHIYLLFPLLVWCWRRFGVVRTVMGSLSLSAVAAAALDGGPLAHVTATYYGLFVLGCLAAALAFRTSGIWPVLRERIPWGMAAGALAVCICAFCHGRDIGQVTQLFPFLDYAVGLAAMCLLVRAAIPENASEGARPAMPNRVAGVLGARPLAALGTFAYSLYLVHAPLLQVVYVYVVRPMGRGAVGSLAALIGIGTPLIVGAAYLFYLIFERPFVGQSVRRAAAADTSAIAPDAV